MLISRFKMLIYDWSNNQTYFLRWLNNISPGEKFFVIQIGANDGKRDDPIYAFIQKWNSEGLLIEPQPDVFQRLKEHHRRNSKIIFENIAISDKTGITELWCYQPQGKQEEWHSLISTLELGKGFSSLVGDKDSWKTLPVRTLTLDDVIKDNGIKKIDLLVIDTEGHDFKILSAFSFSVKPAAVYYEHSNITYYENFWLHEKLISLGYMVFVEKANTFALLK